MAVRCGAREVSAEHFMAKKLFKNLRIEPPLKRLKPIKVDFFG
jgi:hypothetical protein